jgi:hypothetical protein
MLEYMVDNSEIQFPNSFSLADFTSLLGDFICQKAQTEPNVDANIANK